jgi:hypothetical protein
MADNDSRDPAPNPYAAPQAGPASGASPAAEKARRVNLINRRTAALLFEMAAYYATLGCLAAYVFHSRDTEGPPLVMFSMLPCYLLRDILGDGSPAKRMLGLRLVSGDGRELPSVGARILRNVTLMLPVLPVVEYFVAFYGNATMQRLGDRLAGTRVEDVDPARYGKGSYSATMLASIVAVVLASLLVNTVAGGLSRP